MRNLFDRVNNYWNREWVIRLISLCIAVLLWYLVGGEDLVEKNITVPVEVINLPKELVIANKFKKDLEVTVKGPRSAFSDSGYQNPLQIDLSNAQPGTHVKNISVESIPVKRGVEVLRVQPSSIILSLDTLVEKRLSIKPVLLGTVPQGYTLVSLNVSPPSISITGPQTVLAAFDSLQTAMIDLKGMTASAQIQVPLQLNASLVDLIGETSVTADVEIALEMAQVTVEHLCVQYEQNGAAVPVSPADVAVTVSYPKIFMDKETDFHKMLTAMAEPVEGDNRLLRVQVRPSGHLEAEPEILKVTPQFVAIVTPDRPDVSAMAEDTEETEPQEGE